MLFWILKVYFLLFFFLVEIIFSIEIVLVILILYFWFRVSFWLFLNYLVVIFLVFENLICKVVGFFWVIFIDIVFSVIVVGFVENKGLDVGCELFC